MENRSSGSRRDRARMKCLFFIVLFLPVVYSQSQVYLAECGKVSHSCEDPTRRISGGEETCSEMQPWHALIKFQGKNSVKCGGVLITERHVLSAAHCYWSNSENCHDKFHRFTLEECRADEADRGCSGSGCIRFGEHDILVYLGVSDSAELGYGEVKTVKKLDLHPGWVKQTKLNGIYQGHDLALLTLRSRVDTACTHIMPICLPLQPSVIGKMAYVVGFGLQSPQETSTTRLKEVKVQIMECENRAGNQNWRIRGSQVCALGKETDQGSVGDSCKGDSGGGLYYFDASNKRNYLLGITSFGEHNCGFKGGRPGVYTNVYEHKAWIENITNTESDNKCSKPIQNCDTSTPSTATRTRPGNCSQKKVVCYFPSWAYYRPGLGSYKVEDIDASLCSHMYYAFATLDGSTYTMSVTNSALDIDQKNYEKFVGLRAQFPNKKFLISLGGWTDSRTDKYSTLLASAALRTNFVTKAVEFISKYKFDGLDMFYQYPALEKPAHEKSTFSQLVKELKTAFKPYGWELTAAGAPGKEAIDAGYDVPEISKYLDAIHLITYDTHGPWESVVGHHAPLYFSSPLDYVTVNFTVNYWLSKGAPKSKLIVGIPTFGRSWKLCSSSTNIGSRGCGPGTPGSIIAEGNGLLSYQEICLSNGWTVVDDDTGSRGPYAFKGDQWVGYDEPFAAGRKAKYIGDNDLGGAMIWDLSSDDFNGRCPRGRYPMISTVANVFKHDLCQGT